MTTPAVMVVQARPPFKCLYSTKWKCQRRAPIQIEVSTKEGIIVRECQIDDDFVPFSKRPQFGKFEVPNSRIK
jgi:hypothetical protein